MSLLHLTGKSAGLGSAALGLVLAWFSGVVPVPADDLIVAVPVAGGQSILAKNSPSIALDQARGLEMCFDEVNHAGGIKGNRIRIQYFDDQDTPDGAKLAAEQIAKSNALIVAGHATSRLSVAAGSIYKQNRIPALSGTATANLLTEKNDWYFLSQLDAKHKGEFYAYYSRRILNQPATVVIFDPYDPFDSYTSRGFVSGFEDLNDGAAPKIISFDSAVKDLDDAIQDLVANVNSYRQANPIDNIALFLSERLAPKVVVALRKRGILNPIIGGPTLAQGLEGYRAFSEERNQPGFFSDGIMPMGVVLYDVLGESAKLFQERYRAQYHSEPPWSAAAWYDAGQVIVQALKSSGAQGDSHQIEAERNQIREALGAINSPDSAVKGITGLIYFSDDRYAIQPVGVGVLANDLTTSAFVQLTPITGPVNPNDLTTELASGKVVRVADQYLRRTDVVATGIKVYQISDIDLVNKTYSIDFNIWFRYQDSDYTHGVADIEFLNAADSVQLGKPLTQEKVRGVNYELYNVKGKFRADFVPDRQFDEHIFGVAFVNKEATREHLIYVVDQLGLSEPQASADQGSQGSSPSKYLNSSTGLRAIRTEYFQDSYRKDSEGDPEALRTASHDARYSRFSLAITTVKSDINFRRSLPPQIAFYLLLSGTFVYFTTWVIHHQRKIFRLSGKALWAVETVAALLVLFSLETITINWLAQRADTAWVDAALLLFSTLWWLVPAVLLIRAIKEFVWLPLEAKTGQAVPTLVTRMVSSIIILFTVFAIVGYVFHQPITSLLGASGLFLTLIGLAIQINISNVFSGLALNLEKAFKVGDRLQIPEQSVNGVIQDINWRATRILSDDGDIVSIPNSVINNHTIINRSIPRTYSCTAVEFCLPLHAPIEEVRQVMLEAVEAVSDPDRGPLLKPPPGVLNPRTSVFGMFYRVYFNYPVHGTLESSVKSRVNVSVVNHLAKAGFRLVEVKPDLASAPD